MTQPAYQVVHSLPGRIRVRMRAIHGDPPLAAGVQHLLNSQDGVRMARASPSAASVTITFNPEAFDPLAWLGRLNLEQVRRLDMKLQGQKLPEPLSALRRATFAFEAFIPPRAQCALGVISLLPSVLGAPAFLGRIAISAALLPILNRALQTLLDERRLGADALDGLSCLLLVRGKTFFPAALMTFLIGLGELIRDLVTGQCQQMIAHQLLLSRKSAWLVQGRQRMRVPVLELRPGDKVVVYPGELIAFEGLIAEGAGTVIPASPENDFAPHLVRAGDRVVADTLLMDGKLYVLNERNAARETTDPVREKQRRRWLQTTQLHRFALHTAYGMVLPLLSLAALVFVLTRDIQRAVTIICFDFITGIRIAVPTAVLSSMYKAGKKGIVIRNAGTLEKLAEIDALVFARSGTITQLKPCVTDVFVCGGFLLEDVTRLAAAVQQRYNHLGAYAIYSYARLKSIPVPERTTSSIHAGLGVTGDVEGHNVLVGSTRFMQMRDISLSQAEPFLEKCRQAGDSRLCVAVDGNLAGVIAYQDPLREEAGKVMDSLRKIGVRELAMMTSGSTDAAKALARKAGIKTVHARMLPEDMAALVKSYKDKGYKVAVVGDEAADSLALEQADVAITLGHGDDVARYRADIVLTSESLYGLVDGIVIARQGMSLARQNLAVVSVPNWLGLFLSMADQTNFLKATLLNNGSVIVGAANGLRPLLAQPGKPCVDEMLDV